MANTPIGSPLNPTTPLSNTKPLTPSLFKSKFIFLHEWWLVKPQRKREGLAVGGVASMERERLFLSTVIAKRHEANVLETEDGITIILRGFINASRTCEYGFPSEVCHHFMFGFPHDWKKYSVHSLGDEYIDGVTGFGDSKACSQNKADETLLFNIHDNDFTKKQDFLLSNNEVLNHCLAPEKFCNGLGNSFRNFCKQSKSTDNMECSIVMETMECEGKDKMASLKSSQPQVGMIYHGENGVSDVAVESLIENPENGQALMSMLDPTAGLSEKTTVKSPICPKKLKKDQSSSDHEDKQCNRQKIVEDTGNSCMRRVTRSIAKRSHTMLKKDEKVKVTCVSSPPVRRSPRLYKCRQ